MAKSKAREMATLVCSECGLSNIHTQRNSTNTAERLSLLKYCKVERKRTLHKEKK